MDDTSGSIITDSSLTGNDGSWADGDNNDVTEEAIGGINGGALEANVIGASNNVSIPNNAAYLAGTTGSITIAGWFKATTQTAGEDLLLFKEGAGTTFIFFGLTDGRIWSRMRASTGGWVSFLTGSVGEFTDDKWHHAAVTVDRSTNLTTVYVDGIERNSQDNSVHTGDLGPDTSSTILVRPGDAVDDVRYYSRALSAEEIADLYNANSDACDPRNNPAPGQVCDDGSFYAGYLDGRYLFVTSAAYQTYTRWNKGLFNPPWTVTGYTSLIDGLANTQGLVAVVDAGSPYQAAE